MARRRTTRVNGRAAYDLAVVGGGSAGLTAAIMGGRLGARTLLIDEERLGGDCTRLRALQSAHPLLAVGASHRPGVALRHRGECARGLERSQGSHPTRHRPGGGARDAQCAGRARRRGRLRGRAVRRRAEPALAGRRADRDRSPRRDLRRLPLGPPPIEGLAEAGFIDHRDVFRLDALPERLAVIGGGPIGVELGQALARLGVKVTILQRGSHILPRDDAELTTLLAERLRAELEIVTGAIVRSCARDGDERIVRWERGGRPRQLRCDAILVATGRAANTEALGLELAGVGLRDGRIAVDAHLRTSAPGVYAAGDCAGPHAFTHFASAQARVATRNALFRFPERFDPAAVPWCTFTDPELAHVGMTEAQAKTSGEEIRVYRRGYQHVDRAVTEGAGWGLAKAICRPDGRVLGASLLGPSAGEALLPFVTAIEEGLTLQRLGTHIAAYPTFGRVVTRLAEQRFFDEGVSPWLRRFFGRF